MAYAHLQLNLPSPPVRASALLAGPPLSPPERTYFMGESEVVVQTCLVCGKHDAAICKQLLICKQFNYKYLLNVSSLDGI